MLWLCRVIRVSMKDIWDFNGHGEKVHCMRIEAGDHWIDKDMTAWGRFGGMSFEWAQRIGNVRASMVMFPSTRGHSLVAVSSLSNVVVLPTIHSSHQPFPPPHSCPSITGHTLYRCPGVVGRQEVIHIPLACCVYIARNDTTPDRIITPCISHCKWFFVRSERNQFGIHTTSLKGVVKLPRYSITYLFTLSSVHIGSFILFIHCDIMVAL